MKLIANIPFAFWFLTLLHRLRPLRGSIHRHVSTGDVLSERRDIRKAEDLFGDFLVKKAGIRLETTGQENVPEGPVVFVSNHQSYWDIPVFFAAVKSKPFGFVAKSSLRKIPGFGNWIKDVRSVFIEREDARASLRAIEEGIGLIRQGFSLVIFPEGTRSRSDQMGEFKKGSLRLATKAGVPVVPVTLDGTYRAFEESGRIRPATIKVTIHKAIETKDLGKREAGELAEVVEEIIRKQLEEKSK
ncbi:MAG: 1-acyl-sn-glycerol-3-phosphate acyltransferase [Firmicutes bacterium HGW-Firmicutes-11]|jgi:1-acyl-sn-glycerol-3-phosphate acyltransferase|nr:MAG: 1-acyl-sn-glycerol-3-phosphate acyltransferase [Firmicutes bacterium HGW-Firmicutes-11]